MEDLRGVFTIQSNLYDGAIFAKSSIVDAQLGSKYVSRADYFFKTSVNLYSKLGNVMFN